MSENKIVTLAEDEPLNLDGGGSLWETRVGTYTTQRRGRQYLYTKSTECTRFDFGYVVLRSADWQGQSNDQEEEQNFKAVIGKFSIENSNGSIEILNPELRIYNQPNIVTSEADIKTNFLTDKFMTMNLVQNQDYFNIRYQVKPFMIWIWLSVLIISLGGLKSLIKKKYED